MEKIIKIHLTERTDYINKYNQRILSYDLSNYILEELKGINTKEKIKFFIESDFEMSDLEKVNLIDMIRNNFGADISEILNISKKHRITYLLILLISIFLIIIYSTISTKLIGQYTLILGWVLMEQTICYFLYKGTEFNHKISRRKQIVNAKITFDKITNINKQEIENINY